MADADGDTSTSSSNDSGCSYATEEEDQSIATLPVSKKTKYTGSFKYKTKFSKDRNGRRNGPLYLQCCISLICFAVTFVRKI